MGDKLPSQNDSGQMYSIHSLYWDNVDRRLIEAQKKVFNKFGYQINQHNLHGKNHGLWIEEVLNSAADQDVVVIVDIDCIPLSTTAIERAINSALLGKIFGCAQSANHLDKSFIYAGPMFLALNGATWRKLSTPSMQADSTFDVGGQLTYKARESNVDVDLAYPTEVGVPKWLLGNEGVFGAFTVYDRSYLHLFESRNNSLVESFIDLAVEICSGQVADYRKHVIKASEASHDVHSRKVLSELRFLEKFKSLFKL